MALAAATVWEVRTTGADTNGGGFVTGASGTDYSQQNAAQYALTNGVTQGTTVILTASAATDMIGNIVYVTGGTGAVVAAWYQITAASAGVSITVDRSTGLTAGTGVTLNIGGALASMAQMLTNFTVSGMTAYVKATATYSIGTGLTAGGATSVTVRNPIIGYTTTRGDLGKPTLQATAAITLLTFSVSGYSLENFIIDGNTGTGTNGISATGGTFVGYNIQIKNFSGIGLASSAANGTLFDGIEVFGCGTTAGVSISGTGAQILVNCYIHDNTVPGISISVSGASVLNSTIESNSGASSDGIVCTGSAMTLIRVNLYNNGRDGYRNTSGSNGSRPGQLRNCIMWGNAGFGANLTSGSATLTMPTWSNNAYGSNTSGARSGFAAELGAVTLTGDPFVDAANGDFALNATAGAGAAARAVGSPGVSLFGTGFVDIGALQHQDSGVTNISVSSHNPVIVNRFGVSGY